VISQVLDGFEQLLSLLAFSTVHLYFSKHWLSINLVATSRVFGNISLLWLATSRCRSNLIGVTDSLVPEAHLVLVGCKEADHRDQGAAADNLLERDALLGRNSLSDKDQWPVL